MDHGATGLDGAEGGQAGVLGLGPAALEGGGGGLHDDEVGTAGCQVARKVGKGRLEADQWPYPQARRAQQVEPRAPPAVLDGGGRHAAHPAQQGPQGDVLAERDQAHLVVATAGSVRPHQQRALEDAAPASAGVHVDQHVTAHGPGHRRRALDDAGLGFGVEADAALAPDHQLGAGRGQGEGGALVGTEPGLRAVNDPGLHPGHHGVASDRGLGPAR